MPQTIYRGYDDGGLFRISLLLGHATQSTFTGVTTDDQIISALEFATAASIATLTDITANASITEAGKIDWSSTTANDGVMVFWWDVNPPNTGTTTPPFDMGLRRGWRLQCALVDGGAASAELTCTGIKTTDKLINMTHITTKASIASMVDRTATASIPAAGKVANTEESANDQFMVFWFDLSPASTEKAYGKGLFPKVTIVAGDTAETDIAVTGITTKDEIITVWEWATAASIATCTDRSATDTITITEDGIIQLDTTDTSDDTLMVIWNDLSY